MTYTPTWKKRLILVCGLFENLIFTGSILGWSALNHMLKQEGVYEHHCVWVPRNLTTSGAFQLPSDPLIRTGNDPLTPNFESIDNSLHSNGNRSSLDSFDRSNLPDRSDDVFNENRSPDDTADDDQLPNLESITSLPPSTFPTLPSSTLPDSTSSTSSSFSTTTAAPDQTVPPSIRRRRQIEVNTDSDIEPNITEQPDPDQPEDDQPTSHLDDSPIDIDDPKPNEKVLPVSSSSASASSSPSSSSGSPDAAAFVRVCKKQDTILNLAYTIGTFLNGFTAFVWGFLLDRWGLRIVRLIINGFLTAGCVLLCFTTRENSYLIFPAVSLLCLGGVPLRIADMQFANLFPNRRSSVITFYSGAFSASSIIFVLLKYVYEIGISFQSTCSLLVLLSLMMLPITLFVLPADRVREDDDSSDCPGRIQKPPPPTEFRNPTYRETRSESNDRLSDELKFTRTRFSQLYHQNVPSMQPPITLQKFVPIGSPSVDRKSIALNSIQMPGLNNDHDLMATVLPNGSALVSSKMGDQLDAALLLSVQHNTKPVVSEKELLARFELIKGNMIADALQSSGPNKPTALSVAPSPTDLPLSFSLRSVAFLLHQWWFSWLITYMIMYVGSMGLWIGRVTEDADQAGQYLKIYGLLQVLSLVIAPMAGYLMDCQVMGAKCEPDPFLRRLRMARSGFWPILATTLSLAAVILCKLFDHETAIYVSIVFNTLLRSFLVAVATAYLRIRFPAEHFNKLLGIMSTVGALVTLLQFPLFILESSPETVVWVHMFNASCTALAFLNPLLLLVSPLQQYLIHKEQRIEDEFRMRAKQ